MGNVVFGIIGAIIFAISSIYVGINPIISVVIGLACGGAIATAVMSLFARLAVFSMMCWAIGVALAVLPVAIMPKSLDDLMSRRQPLISIGKIQRNIGKEEVLQTSCKPAVDGMIIPVEVVENPEQALAVMQSIEVVCKNGILNQEHCKTARLKVLNLTK